MAGRLIVQLQPAQPSQRLRRFYEAVDLTGTAMELRELALWIVAGGVSFAVIYAIWTMEGVGVRYVLAIAMAMIAALLATLFVSSRFASWVTSQMRFDSPDGAADVHMFSFLAVNVAALVVGWTIGWVLGGAFARRRRSF